MAGLLQRLSLTHSLLASNRVLLATTSSANLHASCVRRKYDPVVTIDSLLKKQLPYLQRHVGPSEKDIKEMLRVVSAGVRYDKSYNSYNNFRYVVPRHSPAQMICNIFAMTLVYL